MVGSSLAARTRHLLDAIADAARNAGREPSSVRMIAVSKTFSAAMIRSAHALGLRSFGENYVQEWRGKAEELADLDIDWHFIGGLQSNKVKAVVGRVALIHALDRDSLATAISHRAQALGIRQRVLVEVKFAAEDSKGGLDEADVPTALARWRVLKGLNLAGIMVMPPVAETAEASRPYFARAHAAFKQWAALVPGHEWTEISMGTSQDFAVAVANGATLVRLGTALFGPRPPK